MIIGPLAAFEAIAIDDYIRQTRTPTVSCSAAAEDLTQRKPNPWFVRTVGTSAQPHITPSANTARRPRLQARRHHRRRLRLRPRDAGGFQRTFEDNGGKVVQRLLPPLNVPDYGSYIAQIKRDVDAVYAGFAGANGFRFLRQYREYGLKLPVLGSMTTADEGVLRQMGDEAIGVVSGGWYAAGIDTPENKRFVAAVNKEYGADPGYYTLGAYSAARWSRPPRAPSTARSRTGTRS